MSGYVQSLSHKRRKMWDRCKARKCCMDRTNRCLGTRVRAAFIKAVNLKGLRLVMVTSIKGHVMQAVPLKHRHLSLSYVVKITFH